MTSKATGVLIDAAIIGSGQAAPGLAVALAQRGQSVRLFEAAQLGGSCVNVGCTPTKTLRKSARIAHLARRAHEFGVTVGPVSVDFAAAMERMAGVVAASRTGLGAWLARTSGVEVVSAHARLDGIHEGRFRVRAGTDTWLARSVYLNTGTRPIAPNIPGLADVPALTNDTLLALRELPPRLLVLGGSYIGLELGQIFRRLGSEVSIVEYSAAVAAREDEEVSARIAAMLTAEGIAIHVGQEAIRVRQEEGDVVVTVRDRASGHESEVWGTHLLVATGRRPNTEDVGLETVGVARDNRGFVPTNGKLETAVPGIWALGDMNGRGAFTHTSYQDHEIVVANLDGRERSADGRMATYAMFTDPPLGRVGLTERDARALMVEGRRFLLATHEMKFVSRAKEEGETTGVIRLLVDADTHQFVGATLLGIGADEVVQVIGAMIAARAPFEVLRDALPIHPTVTEFFPTILGKLKPLA
ncbi:MAG: mercuric reductase [Gemmatimonadetes bacterium]|nr:mercuric reductase [Gemmatimonadota bacterium]